MYDEAVYEQKEDKLFRMSSQMRKRENSLEALAAQNLHLYDTDSPLSFKFKSKNMIFNFRNLFKTQPSTQTTRVEEDKEGQNSDENNELMRPKARRRPSHLSAITE